VNRTRQNTRRRKALIDRKIDGDDGQTQQRGAEVAAIGEVARARQFFGAQILTVHVRVERHRAHAVEHHVGHRAFQFERRAFVRRAGRGAQRYREIFHGPSPRPAFDVPEAAGELRLGSWIRDVQQAHRFAVVDGGGFARLALVAAAGRDQ
jgi:hypothetical protein